MRMPALAFDIGCPFGCDWAVTREDAVALSIREPNSAGRQQFVIAAVSHEIQHLEAENQRVADALRKHLDSVHPDWTIEQIEQLAHLEPPTRNLGRDGRILEGEIV